MVTRSILIVVMLMLLVPTAFAHVGYVLDDETFEMNKGLDNAFLVEALQNPQNVLLILVSAIIFFALYYYLGKNARFLKEVSYIKKKCQTYQHYVGWIARLGLGIALIGAGTHGVLISPALELNGILSFVQIATGFLLLAGLFTGLAAMIALLLFVAALTQDLYMFGNLDFLGLVLALLFLADAKPGVDDLLGIPFLIDVSSLRKYAPLVLRVGIGVAMIYLALYEKLLNPHLSELVVIGYDLVSVIPVSAAMWVLSAGIIEFLVGFALLFGIRVRLSSAIAFLVLSLSFFYFKEDVYSHITLFATLSALFIYGNDIVKKKTK